VLALTPIGCTRLTSHTHDSSLSPSLTQIYSVRPPSLEVQAEYASLNDCIPPALLQNAVYPKTEEELTALASTFVGDRQGMANTREHQSHEGEDIATQDVLPPYKTAKHFIHIIKPVTSRCKNG
jgi:hypothetical protein